MKIPRSERFFLAVREAWSETQSPLMVSSGAALMSGQATEVFVQKSTRWLTARTVLDFNPADFQQVEAALQASLQHAVNDYRAIAEIVQSLAEASYEQTRRGLDSLESLFANVRAIVLDEWGKSSRQLIELLEEYLDGRGLSYQVRAKQIEESLLGRYQLPSLAFQSRTRILVEPVARFVTGARGAYDLTLASSGDMASFFRDYSDTWQIQSDVGPRNSDGGVVALNQEAFFQVLTDLEQMVDD